MADKPRKISISFPKDRLHVWMQLEEHCEETDESNRSAVIISLIEKALTPPTPDDDNLTGLYELERLSRQVEDLHHQIEELTRIVLVRDEHPEVDELTNHSQHKKSQPNGRTFQSHVDEVSYGGKEIPEHAFGESDLETSEDRQAVARGNDTTVRQEPTHDSTVSQRKEALQRACSRWDATRERWVSCRQRKRL